MRIDRYFQVKGQLREMISFAEQNVVSDPPFNRMHLISCRNLLIYLKRQAQEKVLNSFYFSLSDKGHLFLGTSETLGNNRELFKSVSKKWRIFQKIPGQNARRLYWDQTRRDPEAKKGGTKKEQREGERSRSISSSRGDRMRRSIMESGMPPAISRQ